MSKTIKCPKCKEKIKELLAYSEVVNTYELDKNGDPYVYGNDPLDGYTSFECPECHEVLFTNENEAIKFLKGTLKCIVCNKREGTSKTGDGDLLCDSCREKAELG